MKLIIELYFYVFFIFYSYDQSEYVLLNSFKSISAICDFHILKSYIIYHSYDLNKIICPCVVVSYINRMI